MTPEEKREIIIELMEFVKRATGLDAKSEELAVLPDVARVLFDNSAWQPYV